MEATQAASLLIISRSD